MISRKTNLDAKVRTSDIPVVHIEGVRLANDTMESHANELRKFGEAVYESNHRTRTIIYEALAGAARFWVANACRSDELHELYVKSGIRPSKEDAPTHLQLLPVIKLMLGFHDRTRKAVRNEAEYQARKRLQKQASDYAMALAFALSEEPDPSRIVDFFSRPTLGIVEAASLYRKTRQKDPKMRLVADPLASLGGKLPIATIGFDALPIAGDGPIALIVERSDAAWVVRAAIDALPAIHRLTALLQGNRRSSNKNRTGAIRPVCP